MITFLQDLWYDSKLRKIYIWIRNRIWYRFDRIYISTVTPDYHDKDYILLHANFQLLTDFIEWEKPFEHIDYSQTDHDVFVEKELKELYHWWKNVYPNREAEQDKLFENVTDDPWKTGKVKEDGFWGIRSGLDSCPEYYEAIKRLSALEQAHWEEEQTNLMRLIAIRGNLWT